MSAYVRFASRQELYDINIIRKEIYNIHRINVSSKINILFNNEVEDYLYEFYDRADSFVCVAADGDDIYGYSMVSFELIKDDGYNKERLYAKIEEFGIKEEYRRTGIGNQLFQFIKEYSREIGVYKIEVEVWDANDAAISFYEKNGLKTYRRLMEMDL